MRAHQRELARGLGPLALVARPQRAPPLVPARLPVRARGRHLVRERRPQLGHQALRLAQLRERRVQARPLGLREALPMLPPPLLRLMRRLMRRDWV